MKAWVKEHIQIKAWGIFGFTTIMSLWGWSKQGTDVTNAYQFFPLLGLIAFGTMWGHYVMWALREWSGADVKKTEAYSKATQWIVLVALISHPVILITRLKLDGYGLPPASYKAYVGANLVGFVLLGMIALLAFLAYEFKKWLVSKPKVWKAVIISNHIAMLAIVVHALKLGNASSEMPQKLLMPVYGISLVAIYIYLASKKKLI